MKDETAIRLSAWFDGESSPQESSEMEALLRDDPEARAYVEQLQLTREALGGAHVAPVDEGAALLSLNEQLKQSNKRQPAGLLHFPRYAAAAAAVLALGMGVWFPLRKLGDRSGTVGLESSVYMVETELENATPVVYIDEPSGWTVVWILEDELPEQG